MTERLETNGRTFTIKQADSVAEYEGLRSLWCRTFTDDPDFVDAAFERFGNDICGYVVIDEDGEIRSALTCYACGTFEGKTVWVSYAVCTDVNFRGLGLAGALVSFVKEAVISRGDLALVSPAEESLVSFYEKCGYEPFFCVSELAAISPDFDEDEFEEYEGDFEDDQDFEPFRPDFDFQQLDAEIYNRYREAFLISRPHVELSETMLGFIEDNDMMFFAVNHGDAICTVREYGKGRTMLAELIINPILEEISSDIGAEIASMIAKHFGDLETVYRTPGPGRCQSMLAGLSEDEPVDLFAEPYFGFPVE